MLWDEVFDIFLPMIVGTMYYDALAAIVAGRVLGLNPTLCARLKRSLLELLCAKKSFHLEDIVILNDAYNANLPPWLKRLKH